MASHISFSYSKWARDSHEGLYAILLVLAAALIFGGAYLTLRPLFTSDLSVHAPAQSAPDDVTPI